MTVETRVSALEPLVRPASVAVIGASPDVGRYPGKVLHNLRHYGFPGRVYGVNPKYDEVMGYPCVPNMASIGERVDVALVLLSAAGAPAALESAIEAGCRSAIVFASGMAETGEEGAALQRRVRELAQAAGIRVLGPNGLGFINAADGIVLSGAAALQRGSLIPGKIGLAAQSGGLMGSIMDRAWEEEIGFSYAFSTGNEADLTLADCLAFMIDDPKTEVVALFSEAVRDLPTFVAACERAAELGKAVVILKVGRSERGQQVAMTHTAALTGNDAALDALFHRLGVIRVDDVDELFTVPNILVNAPTPRGRRIAAACVSGGLAGLSADLCDRYGIELAELAEHTVTEIRAIQAGFGDAGNPLDITGQVVSKDTWWQVRRMQELLLADPSVDLLVFGQPTSQYAEQSAEDIVAVAKASDKPMVSLWTGRHVVGPAQRRLRQAQVPVFEQPDLCYRSVRRVLDLVAFRERRARMLAAPRPAIDTARRDEALRMLRAAPDGLSEHESKRLLALYGLPVSAEHVVLSAAEAMSAADELGYPVAVKAHGRELRHKSDLDAVRLALGDVDAVRAAYAEVTAAAGGGEALVARMAPPGVELILGLSRDADVGLLLLVGIGGIFVEVLEDVALAVPPLWPGEAEALLGTLRGSKLLDGVRGRPAPDRTAIVRAVESLSRLAAEVGDAIEQLDINPLIAGPGGAVAVDALVIPRVERSV